MLSKTENKVMTAIYYQSRTKRSVLLSAVDVVEKADVVASRAVVQNPIENQLSVLALI